MSLDLAIKVAEANPSRRYKLAAVITNKRGKVLSVGMNSYTKTHPHQARWAERVGKHAAIFLHAEIDALVRCREEPYAIHIARVGRDGRIRLAAPCPICVMAIKHAGIQVVEHTTQESNHG